MDNFCLILDCWTARLTLVLPTATPFTEIIRAVSTSISKTRKTNLGRNQTKFPVSTILFLKENGGNYIYRSIKVIKYRKNTWKRCLSFNLKYFNIKMFWFISTACFKSNSVNTHYCLLTVNYILLYVFIFVLFEVCNNFCKTRF